ncbi:unnamed protein product [Gongylonema pulchrum]|uniref:Transposase n=1 Tax=Gongylonema pulchrum TaxID=637853 RepID=A0A183DF89_9BILA|nr:unnamed protein product [Gongylonema pulchrum]
MKVKCDTHRQPIQQVQLIIRIETTLSAFRAAKVSIYRRINALPWWYGKDFELKEMDEQNKDAGMRGCLLLT